MPPKMRTAPVNIEEWRLMPVTLSANSINRSGFYVLQAEGVTVPTAEFVYASVGFSLHVLFPDGTTRDNCSLQLKSKNVRNINERKLAVLLSGAEGLEGLVGIKFFRQNQVPVNIVNYILLGGVEAVIKQGRIIQYRGEG